MKRRDHSPPGTRARLCKSAKTIPQVSAAGLSRLGGLKAVLSGHAEPRWPCHLPLCVQRSRLLLGWPCCWQGPTSSWRQHEQLHLCTLVWCTGIGQHAMRSHAYLLKCSNGCNNAPYLLLRTRSSVRDILIRKPLYSSVTWPGEPSRCALPPRPRAYSQGRRNACPHIQPSSQHVHTRGKREPTYLPVHNIRPAGGAVQIAARTCFTGSGIGAISGCSKH